MPLRTKELRGDSFVHVTNGGSRDDLGEIGDWLMDNNFADAYKIDQDTFEDDNEPLPNHHALWVAKENADLAQQKVIENIYFKVKYAGLLGIAEDYITQKRIESIELGQEKMYADVRGMTYTDLAVAIQMSQEPFSNEPPKWVDEMKANIREYKREQVLAKKTFHFVMAEDQLMNKLLDYLSNNQDEELIMKNERGVRIYKKQDYDPKTVIGQMVTGVLLKDGRMTIDTWDKDFDKLTASFLKTQFLKYYGWGKCGSNFSTPDVYFICKGQIQKRKRKEEKPDYEKVSAQSSDELIKLEDRIKSLTEAKNDLQKIEIDLSKKYSNYDKNLGKLQSAGMNVLISLHLFYASMISLVPKYCGLLESQPNILNNISTFAGYATLMT